MTCRGRRGAYGLLIATCIVVPSCAESERSLNPFFDHAELLSIAYGAEMLGIRLSALQAVADAAGAPRDLQEAATRDLHHFIGSLEVADPSLAGELDRSVQTALRSVAVEGSVAARVDLGEAIDNTGRVNDVLIPPFVREDPSFVAAMMTMLLLAEDGVAEAYEEAVEGDAWSYSVGWAALQRVEQLRGRIEIADSEAAFEIEDMLEALSWLFPSPTPPDQFRGDPEEAEAPAHRIIGFLERATGASLYPGRNLDELTDLVDSLVGDACDHYGDGDVRVGAERILAAQFHYDDSLEDRIELVAPELHETLELRFGRLVADANRSDAPEAECRALLGDLSDARDVLPL